MNVLEHRTGHLRPVPEPDMPDDGHVRGLTIEPAEAAAITAGETTTLHRPRSTLYRGTVLITAPTRINSQALADLRIAEPSTGPRAHPNAVLAIATLIDTPTDHEPCTPDSRTSSCHWVLHDIRALSDPVPCPDRPGLWTPPEALITQVARQHPALADDCPACSARTDEPCSIRNQAQPHPHDARVAAWSIRAACCPKCQVEPGIPCHHHGSRIPGAHAQRETEAARTRPDLEGGRPCTPTPATPRHSLTGPSAPPANPAGASRRSTSSSGSLLPK